MTTETVTGAAVSEQTTYSKTFKGDRGNYGWSVSFDVQDRYVGINQIGNEKVTERVLLSPSQYKALLRFMGVTEPQTGSADR